VPHREAREPLSLALDIAHRCGANALHQRVDEELPIAGGRPRTPLLSGVDALTPSERRVAAMAAEGLSNPEIAQALFVTRKTVEMHLSNAYRKLEVGGRDELGAVLTAD
jgi:DNA-binding CsgD family transcriptional regulator